MKVVGLVTEYNPFHNGHLHHLRESLRVSGTEASVAVMSGHFLQRGEPALIDKWARTEMALVAGVDLVLELPFPFACNSAPTFAKGAVQTLEALGVVDAFCFGSEHGELAPLSRAAEMLIEHADLIAEGTGQRLRQGASYPAARVEVLNDLDPGLPGDLLAAPNNILGVEYLRSMKALGSSIVPFTIQRLGAGYHAVEAVGSIASATGIRKRLAEAESVTGLMPPPCVEILTEATEKGRVLDLERLYVALQSSLLNEPVWLEDVYQVEAGLAQRLVGAARSSGGYRALAAAVKSRHWTLTRIQRILSYVLLQVSRKEMQECLESGPLYLRLLGSSAKGRDVLSRSRKRRHLPMIADPAKARATLRRFYRESPELFRRAETMLALELRTTRIYGLLQSAPPTHFNQDYFQTVRSA